MAAPVPSSSGIGIAKCVPLPLRSPSLWTPGASGSQSSCPPGAPADGGSEAKASRTDRHPPSPRLQPAQPAAQDHRQARSCAFAFPSVRILLGSSGCRRCVGQGRELARPAGRRAGGRRAARGASRASKGGRASVQLDRFAHPRSQRAALPCVLAQGRHTDLLAGLLGTGHAGACGSSGRAAQMAGGCGTRGRTDGGVNTAVVQPCQSTPGLAPTFENRHREADARHDAPWGSAVALALGWRLACCPAATTRGHPVAHAFPPPPTDCLPRASLPAHRARSPPSFVLTPPHPPPCAPPSTSR